jgi:hypothetical protein
MHNYYRLFKYMYMCVDTYIDMSMYIKKETPALKWKWSLHKNHYTNIYGKYLKIKTKQSKYL